MAGKSYRDQKVDFVSNLSGGSLLEINLVTLVAPVAVFLWSALQARRSFFTPYGPVALITDFLLNVGAILFAITLYSSAPLLLNLLLISPSLPVLLLPVASSHVSRKASKRVKSPASPSQTALKYPGTPTANNPAVVPVQSFLTSYRGGMMIITCLAILAVDFPVFPRRFAKVENWGTSLMDMGVGSFVFSAGVVSARSILKDRLSSSLGGHSSVPTKSISARLLVASRHSVPLFALGLIRLLSVKNLDYAEHVTEYGVHWNFFFTLGLIPPVVEIADLFITTVANGSHRRSRGGLTAYEILSFFTALVYEIILNNTSLTQFILVSPRLPTSSLLAKNREGVFSFIGYLSIFLAGRGTGLVVLSPINSNPQPISKSTKPAAVAERLARDRRRLLLRIGARAMTWSFVYVFATHYAFGNLSVSRRLANLPYVVWVVAFNIAQILLFGLVETVTFPESYSSQQSLPPNPISHSTNSDQNHSSSSSSSSSSYVAAAEFESPTMAATRTSKIISAFNSNGLVVFLIANLLTGLVNLTVDTLRMRDWQAMTILLVYAAVLTGFALALQSSGIRIKL